MSSVYCPLPSVFVSTLSTESGSTMVRVPQVSTHSRSKNSFCPFIPALTSRTTSFGTRLLLPHRQVLRVVSRGSCKGDCRTRAFQLLLAVPFIPLHVPLVLDDPVSSFPVPHLQSPLPRGLPVHVHTTSHLLRHLFG